MIFDDEVLSQHWVSTIGRVTEVFEAQVLAWCLLTNHFHLVIRTGELPLWAGLARTQVTTAKFHNRVRGVKGPLWQSAYKAKLVQDQAYLEQLFAYVHLNPVAAGLVDDPQEYELSGHLELIGSRRPQLVDRRAALGVFGVDPQKALERYLLVIRNLAEVRWIRESVRNLPWWKSVADDHQLVEESDAPAEATFFDGEPVPGVAAESDLHEMVRRFAEVRSVDLDELLSGLRTEALTRERRLLILHLLRRGAYNANRLACLMKRNPSSVSRWLSQAASMKRTDSSFRAEADEVERELSRSECNE
jgi:REP element-mobilizing transposase RayT